MRKILFILILIASTYCYGQENHLRLFTISAQSNLNVWRPLDNGSKQFISNGGKISTYYWKSCFGFTIFRNKKYPIKIGGSYQIINHTVKDRIKSFTYNDSQLGNQPVTHNLSDPMDLNNKSKLFGVLIEPMYKVLHEKKSSGYLGLNMSYYFIEFYKSNYYTSDPLNGNPKDAYDKINLFKSVEERNFRISNSSLELFYLHNFNLKPNFSLGVRASLGGNMYSNWNQFKRYIWAGVGVEMSFGGNKKVEE